MAIVEEGAVVVQESIFIKAAPAEVWKVFSKAEDWTRWNPVCVRALAPKGSPWARGGRLDLTLRIGDGQRVIRATIVRSEPPAVVEWRDRSYGRHVFSFEPEEGGTRVTSYHEVAGGFSLRNLLLPVARIRAAPPELRVMAARWLQALKAEVEGAAAV